MNSKARLLYGDKNVIQNKQLTFLFPITTWYPMFSDSIASILQPTLDIEFEIIVILDSEDEDRNRKVIEHINKIGSNRVWLYCHDGKLEKNELYNLGFQLSCGKWISLVEDNFVFLPNALDKIGKLISFQYDLGNNISHISIWSFKLRIEYQNRNQLYREINHKLSRVSEDLDKFKLVELTDKNFWTYGGYGINVPQRGSLYLREAFMKTDGFKKEYYPLENVFLVKEMEHKGQYKTYLSINPYGIHVTLDSIFKTKEEVLKAYDLWMRYIENKVKSLWGPTCVKRRKLKYLKHKYIKFLMSRHKSLNLTFEDFGYDGSEISSSKMYIISYVYSNWKYNKWFNKQCLQNEKRKG